MGVRALAHDVLNFVYPPRCVGCGADADGTFCAACTNELDAQAAAPACKKCAMPLATVGAPCPYCHGKGVFPFERIIALGVFKDPLKRLIHGIKYHHRWPVAETLAARLFDEERTKGLLTETHCVVPVPLHWSRHVARGYNQADALARQLASAGKIRCVRPLVRLKPTPAQTTLRSRAARADNLRDAFGLVNPNAVRGKDVVLVDDVMTTAATLRAAARTLREGRPASISAIVLAVADPRREEFESV